jgi:hypothetical protein
MNIINPTSSKELALDDRVNLGTETCEENSLAYHQAPGTGMQMDRNLAWKVWVLSCRLSAAIPWAAEALQTRQLVDHRPCRF